MIGQKVSFLVKQISSFLPEQNVEKSTVQRHETLTVFVLQPLPYLGHVGPSFQFLWIHLQFLEQILPVVKNHGAQGLGYAQNLALVGEDLQPPRVQALGQTRFFDPGRQIDERRRPVDENPEKSLVQLDEIGNSFARAESHAQFVRHFAKTVGLDLEIQLLARFFGVQFAHFLVVDLILKRTDPQDQVFSTQSMSRKDEEKRREKKGNGKKLFQCEHHIVG